MCELCSNEPARQGQRGAYIGPPHSYHESQVHICVITGLERQKFQHECANCVKMGLEYQNLTRFSRAWVGGAIDYGGGLREGHTPVYGR